MKKKNKSPIKINIVNAHILNVFKKNYASMVINHSFAESDFVK